MGIRSQLEVSMVALDDWLNIFAESECDPERVKEARERTNAKGTIVYIADIQHRNREVLKITGIGMTANCPMCDTTIDLNKDIEQVSERWRVMCPKCNVQILRETQEEAIDAWETRA